jgi:hypothetical protein
MVDLDSKVEKLIATVEALLGQVSVVETDEAVPTPGSTSEAEGAADPEAATEAASVPADPSAEDEDEGKKPPFMTGDEAGKVSDVDKVPVPISAMDAASIAASVTAAITAQFAAKEVAAEAVRPMVGQVQTTTFDSAESIYAFALDQAGMDSKQFDPSAYAGMVAVLAQTRRPAPLMAADSQISDAMTGIDLSRFGVK